MAKKPIFMITRENFSLRITDEDFNMKSDLKRRKLMRFRIGIYLKI